MLASSSWSLDPLPVLGLVLLGVLGLLGVVSRGLGAGGRRGPSSVALTRDHAVHVVELGAQRLLIGTGPSGAPRLLAELPPVTEADEDSAASSGRRLALRWPWGGRGDG